MPQAETAVEQAIYSLGGTLFARLINPLIIVFVSVAIALFLFIIFRRFSSNFFTGGNVAKDKGGLLYPLLGLTIMLSAIGITFFIGNTGNEIFQGPVGGGAVKGINDVVRPIEIR